MATLTTTTSFSKWSSAWIFLRTKLTASRGLYFCLITLHHNRNECWMHPVLTRLWKIQSVVGLHVQAVQKCKIPCCQMGPSSCSTSQMTIWSCLGGLKGWKLSSKSAGYFSCNMTANLLMGNAKVSNALEEQWTTVAIASLSINQTLLVWSLISRKSSWCVDTSVTFTPNSIVN